MYYFLLRMTTGMVYPVMFSLLFFSCSKPGERGKINEKLLKQLTAKRVLLPNGWSLTPPSNSIPLDELPLNLQISSSGRFAAVTNNGYGTQSIMLFDVKEKNCWTGWKFPKPGTD